MKDIKRILVVRNDRIGDVVLSLPAITALKRRYPSAHIAILIKPCTQDILYQNPDIDEVILDRGEGIFQLSQKIKKKGFDMVIILYPSLRNGLLCWLARIPLRIGTGYKPVGLLFNQRVYIHRKGLHEVDYCLKLASAGGVLSEEREIRFKIREKDRVYASNLLEGLSHPIICIHPANKGSALNWTERRYAELLDKMKDFNVVLTGTKEDAIFIDRILSLSDSSPLNLVGKTSLGELMGVLSLCDVFIGPSTGPMHIAGGSKTPVIALFPPISSQSPLKWAPLGDKHTILIPSVECKKKRCSHKCRLYNCMDKITADEVIEAMENYI